MAVAGSAASSIFLALQGEQLVEGAVMLRQSAVVLDAPEDAWLALLTHGQCYLRLYGDNLIALRTIYARWLAAPQALDSVPAGDA